MAAKNFTGWSSTIMTELRKFAEKRWLDTIRTTLLGKVQYKINCGVYEPSIPSELQDAAKRHGLVIITADFRDNSYTLKLLRAI